MSKGDRVDHLAEARRYAEQWRGIDVPDRIESSRAIVDALIAIAERLEPGWHWFRIGCYDSGPATDLDLPATVLWSPGAGE